MKKNKAIMAMTLSMSLGLAGCSQSFFGDEEPVCIYGPPSAFESTTEMINPAEAETTEESTEMEESTDDTSSSSEENTNEGNVSQE